MSAPPLHHYGNYPPFPEVCPVYCVPPPPHYSVEQPRYEYYKDEPGSYHCCGCPDHPCHQQKERGVKIEEQEPEVKKNEGNAVASVQLRNYPYPIVWIPPENVKNKEDQKSVESEVRNWDEAHGDTKSIQGVKSPEWEPKVWNDWFPLAANGLNSSM
ncbi:hypothetical protein SLE2022_181060 [Rubroshorea leprosula]